MLALRRSPLFPVLLCALLWGSAFPSIKIVYQSWDARGVEVGLAIIFLFAGIRFCVAGGGLLLAGKETLVELRQTSWKTLLVFAATQTFFQYVFFYNALHVASASLASLLVATGSLWWMILAPLLQKTAWPRFKQWGAFALGAIGVTLAVYAPGASAGSPVLGAILVIAATGSGAVAVILFQEIKTTMSAINATGFSLFGGGIGLCGLGIAAVPEIFQLFDPKVALITLWLAFVSAAAFSLWNYLTTIHPVTVLASYRFLIPVCGVAESLVFLKNEKPGWGLFVGGGLVVLSLILAEKLRGEESARPVISRV